MKCIINLYVIIIVLDYWFIVLVIFHVMCIRHDIFACINYYNYEVSKLNNIK